VESGLGRARPEAIPTNCPIQAEQPDVGRHYRTRHERHGAPGGRTAPGYNAVKFRAGAGTGSVARRLLQAPVRHEAHKPGVSTRCNKASNRPSSPPPGLSAITLPWGDGSAPTGRVTGSSRRPCAAGSFRPAPINMTMRPRGLAQRPRRDRRGPPLASMRPQDPVQAARGKPARQLRREVGENARI
jgi:hypothetical protein